MCFSHRLENANEIEKRIPHHTPLRQNMFSFFRFSEPCVYTLFRTPYKQMIFYRSLAFLISFFYLMLTGRAHQPKRGENTTFIVTTFFVFENMSETIVQKNTANADSNGRLPILRKNTQKKKTHESSIGIANFTYILRMFVVFKISFVSIVF